MACFGNGFRRACRRFPVGLLAAKGSLYVTRPDAVHPHRHARDHAGHGGRPVRAVGSGKLKIPIDQRYPLAQVQQAHRDLEARKTTGSTILTL